MKTIETLDPKPFRRLCMTIGELPTSYLDSMTYYEMVAWLCEYIKKNVVTAINDHAAAIAEIQQWIETLDLQDEVDDKIDRMKESGELAEIITQYLEIHGILAFDSVADMKSAENLIDGSFVETYGFYQQGDGGGAKYKVREVTNQDTVDEMRIIALNDEDLVAELVITNEVNVKQFGAKGDGETDDVVFLQTAINNCSGRTLYIPKGTYNVSTPIDITNDDITIVGCGAKSVLYKTTDIASNVQAVYKEQTFNFSSYPSIINLIFPTDSTRTRFNISNVALNSYSPTYNYGIVAPYMSYSQISNIRFNRFHRAAYVGGWVNKVDKCSIFNSGGNFEFKSAIATSVLNCSSNQGSWFSDECTNLTYYAVSSDNGNPCFLATDCKSVNLTDCSTETYSYCIKNDGSNIFIKGGDYEGHSAADLTLFQGFFQNIHNGNTYINGSKIHFEDYGQHGNPDNKNIGQANTGLISMENVIIEAPYTWRNYVTAGGTIKVNDQQETSASYTANIKKYSTNVSGSSTEICRIPFGYGKNYMIFVKSYGTVGHTAITINDSVGCCANAGSTINKTINYNVNSNQATYAPSLTFNRDEDTNELVVSYATSAYVYPQTFKIDTILEYYSI